MSDLFSSRLATLRDAGSTLRGGRIGIEREALRVQPDGKIAQSPHPPALGAPLTHRHITTDFSEALIELITPPFPDAATTLACLDDIHRVTFAHLGDERLWPTSMPCRVADEAQVPIAEYGTSHAGRLKHVYRQGLGRRYGRLMQIIAGVHFNYSVPDALLPTLGRFFPDAADAPSTAYFALVRNFQRWGWVVPYLFGASPALCRSLLRGGDHGLQYYDATTAYLPYATSLRMSDLGYRKDNLSDLGISYDSLGAYVESLTRATRTPHPPYQRLGVRDGETFRQLNANLLQIENEHYDIIRPKQLIEGDERPTTAMRARGVLYVEVRALDLDPFEPLGVAEDTLRFLEALLLMCLLDESPPIEADEARNITVNLDRVTLRGREPALTLRVHGQDRPLQAWLGEILDKLSPLCTMLGPRHEAALARQRAACTDPELTPSARILREMREGSQSFVTFASIQAERHAAWWRAHPPSPEVALRFAQEAHRSFARQAKLEAEDRGDFVAHLHRTTGS